MHEQICLIWSVLSAHTGLDQRSRLSSPGLCPPSSKLHSQCTSASRWGSNEALFAQPPRRLSPAPVDWASADTAVPLRLVACENSAWQKASPTPHGTTAQWRTARSQERQYSPTAGRPPAQRQSSLSNALKAERTDSVRAVVRAREASVQSPTPAYWLPASFCLR